MTKGSGHAAHKPGNTALGLDKQHVPEVKVSINARLTAMVEPMMD